MPESSAGIILYRRRPAGLEVLLIHPGGPYWARKDEGVWSIPKGIYSDEEAPEMAARREFAEETGLRLAGPLLDLGSFRQPSGKLLRAFAAEGDFDPAELVSNLFPIEWPPRSGRTGQFPEADRAAWFALPEARAKLLKGQLPILEALPARLQASVERPRSCPNLLSRWLIVNQCHGWRVAVLAAITSGAPMRPFHLLAALPLVAALAACDQSPQAPAPPSTPAAQPAATTPAAAAPAAATPAGTPAAPLFGSWAADLRDCGTFAVEISATRFLGAENQCDITELVDNGDGTFTASLACISEGQATSERIRMTPVFAPTGEGVTLRYLDRGDTEATLLRCR